jgi:SAM-dependent methyltransferase
MMRRLPPLDARIPAWNLEELVARPCPYCGTAENESHCIRPDGLTVRECRHCSAFFVSPAPTEAQLASFYANYDKAHRLESPATPAELRTVYRNRGPLHDLRVRELSSMMAFEHKRVLDVGFGRAQFMWCLQSLGADVHGIELDDAAIAIARALGITNVRKATIEECAGDRPYDLIVLNDVVEHPLDPMKLLRACTSLLAPGGVMLIWTPNGAAARGTEANGRRGRRRTKADPTPRVGIGMRGIGTPGVYWPEYR